MYQAKILRIEMEEQWMEDVHKGGEMYEAKIHRLEMEEH